MCIRYSGSDAPRGHHTRHFVALRPQLRKYKMEMQIARMISRPSVVHLDHRNR
jgi:hypothetical protein